MDRSRPIIIGGGITGLSAAYEFVQAGQPALLLEPRARLGGVIETETVEGCVLEGGPDSFLAAKPAGLELIHELGLRGELIGSNDSSRKTYLVRDGRLIAMPDGLMMMVPTKILPVALSPLLSWPTKLRMGLEYFRRPPAEPEPDRSVGDFIRSHYGQETVDYLAEPLLSGVYGGSVERLSVNSVLARFVELETRHGSLTRGVLAARRAAASARNGDARAAAPLFQTLKGGLAQLTRELERRIAGGIEVRREAAEAIESLGDRYRVRAGGETLETPAVIVATPAWQAGALLAAADAELAALLGGVDYSSSVTIALGYDTRECGPIPPGFGILVPARERKALVACTFVGAKFPYRVSGNRVVLRCFAGGADNAALLDLDDGELLERIQADLEALLGWRRRPLFTRVARWRRSMAQYGVGHQARVARIFEKLKDFPGLQLAGNAYDGVGVPDCIRTGRAAAVAALRACRIGA
jgi:oxygen-dependent protoporphyrinogen oxidase